MPLEEIYTEVKANKRSKHGLSIWLSGRGESKLESFHCKLAHFANCGMSASLADNLNLRGTCKHNRAIRHKRHLINLPEEERDKMPVGWEEEVSFDNHVEIKYINALAIKCGAEAPFKHVEEIREDNGERFFSEYLECRKQLSERFPKHRQNDRCQCFKCANNATRLTHDVNSIRQPLPLQQETQQQQQPQKRRASTQINAAPQRPRQEPQQEPQQQQQATPQPQINFQVQQQQQLNPAAYQMAMAIQQAMHWQQSMPNAQPQQPPPRAQREYCCRPYMEYQLHGKKGRPTHSRNCNQRNVVLP